MATYPLLYNVWRFLVRFITPIAVIVVFLRAVDVI